MRDRPVDEKQAPRIPPDAYFMRIAMAVRARADCLGNRIGALITLDDHIVSTGYNGTPENMTNCSEGGCYRCAHREEYPSGTGYDLCICVHAEQNTLLAAARFGISVQEGVLYTTMRPCFGCTKELLQAKIRKVLYLHDWTALDGKKKAEYERLQARFPDGINQLKISDPDEAWAVSAKKEEKTIDETGHGAS